MNLLEWRKSSERLSMAMDMLNQPTMREMVEVMESEHPAKQQQVLADGFAATRAIGKIEGFQLAMDMLRSFAKPIAKPQEDVQTSWGVDLPSSDFDKTT